MSGLDAEQLDEVEYRVAELLEEPWDKDEGRPRELTLREALVVTCGYLRQNIIEDVWADIFDVAQSTISRYITFLTPFVENATEQDRPSEEDAAEATRGTIALVDGTLWPCWSWDGEGKLWAGKYKTTGHGSLIVTNLRGGVTFVSEPNRAIWPWDSAPPWTRLAKWAATTSSWAGSPEECRRRRVCGGWTNRPSPGAPRGRCLAPPC